MAGVILHCLGSRYVGLNTQLVIFKKLQRLLQTRTGPFSTLNISTPFLQRFSNIQTPILQKSTSLFQCTACRGSVVFPCRFASSNRQKKWLEKAGNDNLPKEFVLIYNNQNSHYMRYYILFTIVLSVSSFGYFYYAKNLDLNQAFNHTRPKSEYVVAAFAAFFYMTALCFMFLVLRSSMMRIYRHSETGLFVGVKPSWMFFTEKFTFRLSDIEKQKWRFEKIFPVNYVKGTVKIKNMPFVLRGLEFSSPFYYNEVHGYPNRQQDKT